MVSRSRRLFSSIRREPSQHFCALIQYVQLLFLNAPYLEYACYSFTHLAHDSTG